ncbi:MAG: VWA domain-containing protein [Chloroflexota bacterium]
MPPMTLVTPLALVLLGLIPPIIALYLLKLRRQDQPVSSVYLWQRFVRDIEANAPWQRLRRNLLLLLQILFMLILILALARPATEAEGVAGQTVVLILDTSASMAATDGDRGSSRLETAQAAARQRVANLPDQARLTVITAAGGQAELLASASQDRRQVLNAIAAAQPTALDSDLSPAVTLAEAIVAREPQAEIILLSDGAVHLPDPLAAPVRLIPIGQAGANQAISALSVETNGDLFVQVSNYGDRPARRRLVLQAGDAPFTAFDLELPPGGHVEQIVAALPPEAGVIEAYLAPAGADLLALDDRAWLVLRTAGPVQVTLVTPGNFFLQTALSLLNSQALGKNLELTLTSVADWKDGRLEESTQPSNLPTSLRSQPSNLPSVATSQPATSSTFHIFDSYVPDALPPGNLLFIAPPASAPGLFEVLGQASNPVPQPAQADHPLLQNVALADTQILTAAVVSATTWSRVLAAAATPTGEPVPLLLAGQSEGRRVAVLAFSLQQSDLPLRPAFPILVSNLVDYLAPGAGGLIPNELSAGEALTFSVPPQATRLRLTGPDGRQVAYKVEAGRVSLPPLRQTGLYRLAFEPEGPAAAQFAVNFFNPSESTLTPHARLAVTADPVPESPEAAGLSPARREWWRPLAAVALALLVIEWLVYQRSRLFKYGTALGRWSQNIRRQFIK